MSVATPATSRGTGVYVASETHNAVWGLSGPPTTTRAVIDCQGSHGTADSVINTADEYARLQELARRGFIVVAGDLSQTTSQGTFGNSTSVTRVGQLKTFIQGSSSPRAATGKVHLLGGSGGATAAINYARANPTLVASMYLICPLVDIEDFYNNYINSGANGTANAASGITQAEMNKAYNSGVDDGGTAFAAAMPASNPSRTGNQAALAGIPMKLAYSTNDPYIPTTKVTAYATAVNSAGGTATAYSQGAVGHSGTGVPAGDVSDFFLANP